MKQKLTACKACGSEIAKSAKSCPRCGAKVKKPILKKWWFWVLIVIAIGVIGSAAGSEEKYAENNHSVGPALEQTPEPRQTASPKATPAPTTVIGDSSENDSSLTMGQKNALKSAENYLRIMPFSYGGLIQQLEFEEYSYEEAAYAADNCGADWNEQALKAAKNYLNTMAFSYQGLIQQLEFEKYTTEEATYGADNCDADWNEQAAKSAKNYLNLMPFSKDQLISQLEFEGFTHDQAVYGAEANGY